MSARDRVPAAVIGLAPALLGIAFVLIGFVNNAVPLDQLWRPLLVGIAVAIAFQAVLVLALGWARGSFWAFVAVSALAGLFILAGAAILALTLFAIVTRVPDRQYRLGGLLAAGVAVALAAVQVTSGISSGAFDWRPIQLAPPEVGPLTVGPNIHLLLLDGYPRQDVLDGLGFDNGPFLSAMADRGFEVYQASRSNYDRTPFSLLTLLTLRQLDDIDELDGAEAVGSKAEQARVAARGLLGVPLFDLAEEVGYRTRAVEGPVVHAPLGGADEVSSAGSATNFELDTVQRTPLAALLEFLGIGMDQARDQVTGGLALFAHPPDSPSFTFTHVMAPHAPFSFEADGSDAPAPPCYPESCAIFDGQDEGLGWSEEEHWRHMVGHLAHLNELVMESVDELLTADPEGVIVIFGDHGMRVAGHPENIHRNLLLARTPGHPGLFGAAPTLVNVVPHLLNAYLGGDVALLPDELYTASDEPWFEAVPYLPSSAP